MIKSNKYLVVLAGPSASGKTFLAVQLAKHFNTEIISADSRQFYKEIPIGTAAPELEYLSAVKHHFIGNLSIFDYYNVSKYEKDVLQLLDTLYKTNDIVIMAGGSGLYIDAVCNGIDELPNPDLTLRLQLENDFKSKGIEALQLQLKILDPEYYFQVDLKNPKRLIRAIEVCLQTGKKYSELRLKRKRQRDFKCIKIGLELPRQELFRRINNRVDIMMDRGWIKEAEKVFDYRNLNALNTLGYKELFNYLEGKNRLEFTLEKIKTNTRRYAKRQLTWFKKDKSIKWFDPSDIEKIKKHITSLYSNI